MEKLISFIIPCYNAEKTIDRCLKSITTQDMSKIEIIAVDDNSTDRTREKLKCWAGCGYIRTIYLTEHGLQGRARNIAIPRCTGKYIGFIDADDYLVEGAIDRLIEVASVVSAEMINYLYKSELKGYDQPYYGIEGFIPMPDEEARECFFKKAGLNRCCWNKLIRRDLINKYKMRFAEGVFDEESLFLVPAFLEARSFYNLNEKLYVYCVGKGGSSAATMGSYDHQYDNEKVWEQIWSSLKDWSTDHTILLGYFFAVNYFHYSIVLASGRQVPYSKADIDRLKKNMKEWFPNYRNNWMLSKEQLDELGSGQH